MSHIESINPLRGDLLYGFRTVEEFIKIHINQ